MHEPSAGLHTATYDRIIRLIQRHLGEKIRVPFELRLRGGRTYRFGRGEPAISFVVNDRHGLAALCSFDELRFCEAYMSGSLDVVGDMLKIADFRSILTDRHPLHYL
ncbi:MAG: class I SAM-dependent methyltransferase, partial [Myxococcota bacterium]